MATAQAESTGAAGQGSRVTAHRLLASDGGQGRLWVTDLDTGRLLSTFRLASPARLARGASGRYVHALQAEAARIAVIDSGITLDDHGDHADIAITPPRLLAARLDGPKPAHFNADSTQVAAFFDGSGSAQVIAEADLVSGRMASLRRIETGLAHHGVAKPVGRFIAVSVASAGETLPVAVELRDRQGRASQRIACPRLHGEATTVRFTGFGCADGIALYEVGRGTPAARHIAYGSALPAGRMVRSLSGAAGFAFFAGDFGADGLVVIDPTKADGDMRFIQLPGRRVHFALHPATGDRLFVLIEDGRVLTINPLTGATTHERAVLGRVALDGSSPRPRLTASGPYLAISDPAARMVVVLDAETLAEKRRIAFDGEPIDILAVGGSGQRH
ncbi:hypothetical protein [Phreatobacter stygius]|uniref:DUF1513 domain-containing protein n=1 Tax=Phreatobacter stygius TaxID=1940610 RepID=A0A4D7B8N8_9HYPH|nr:hypothetical protein [Phreatobacter stygius]QCI67295.1 hypothetical protein E8M01_25545 [Phreatobacter stygius]